MNTELRSDEALIKKSPANMQRGLETVGGKLFLTNERLIFEAHAFNIQSGSSELELASITSIEPRWTKFLGFLPVFPNSLAVQTDDGTEFSFVLSGRSKWQQLIERAGTASGS